MRRRAARVCTAPAHSYTQHQVRLVIEFEPFASSKGQAGTGLGLPVARKIVREHHGRTVVESQPGEGTIFRIRLPAQQRFRESEKTVSTPG